MRCTECENWQGRKKDGSGVGAPLPSNLLKGLVDQPSMQRPPESTQPLQPSPFVVGAVELAQAEATMEAITRASTRRGRRFIIVISV